MSERELIEKAMELLKRPTVLCFILLHTILLIIVPAWVQFYNTDRLEVAINKQGQRWERVIDILLADKYKGQN